MGRLLDGLNHVLVPPRGQHAREGETVRKIMGNKHVGPERRQFRARGETARNVRAVLAAVILAGSAKAVDHVFLDDAVTHEITSSVTNLVGHAIDNALGIDRDEQKATRESDPQPRMDESSSTVER